jgi:hypothetical protein
VKIRPEEKAGEVRIKAEVKEKTGVGGRWLQFGNASH